MSPDPDGDAPDAEAPDTEAPDGETRRPSRRALILLAVIAILVPLAGLAVLLNAEDADTGSTPDGAVAPGRAEIGDRAPNFTLDSLAGDPASLSDLRGKPVVLTFFASWCNPCEQEFLLLQKALEKRGDEFGILAVSYQDLPRDSKAFVERLGTEFPVLVDGEGDVALAYGVRAIPQTFFIDANGVVQDRVFGIASEKALNDPLNALLDGP